MSQPKELKAHAKDAFLPGPQRDFMVRLVGELELMKTKVFGGPRTLPDGIRTSEISAKKQTTKGPEEKTA